MTLASLAHLQIRQLLLRSLILVCLGVTSGCSPFFVMRAGYEESRILLGKKPITKVIEKTANQKTKAKLELVQQARSFAAALGLKPRGSFTEYYDIQRDVLVWVLSATPKFSFEPYTWWFPIVGSMPYRGYFSKTAGINAAKVLAAKNYDTFLRSSAAFSTLGWFDDPLLSTTLAADEVALVDTVIHEIVHNTIWVKDNVFFNETMANVIGGLGAYEFFKARGDLVNAAIAEKRIAREKKFSEFIQTTKTQLITLFQENIAARDQELRKQEILEAAVRNWDEIHILVMGEKLKNPLVLNNAAIIAYEIYLKDYQKFHDYVTARKSQNTTYDLAQFIAELEKLARLADSEQVDPYSLLNAKLNP
ncbi:aminopeptidase [bacterium]|nr:aminopeptidase [bacterium]